MDFYDSGVHGSHQIRPDRVVLFPVPLTSYAWDTFPAIKADLDYRSKVEPSVGLDPEPLYVIPS